MNSSVSSGGEAAAPPAVHAEGVVKRFGPTVALDGVRITVAAGDSHALVGRNGAGKSTLVSVLTGLQTPDAGRVAFQGVPAPAPGDTAAWQSKVACVYQKSMVVPDLTVAENLFLNRFGAGRIRWPKLRDKARDLLAEDGVDVDPAARAGDLTVEQGQFVEIARALSFGARFIILDEPTAQLDAAGIERLFTKLRELQRQGVAFLFISHHLQEVYDLCSTVTVYRDARHVLTAPVAELGKADLVEAMTGEAGQAASAWHAPAAKGGPATAAAGAARKATGPAGAGADTTDTPAADTAEP
ncbi:MAG TPA: ATP-binding cassette domain-containing protein, partial [Streptomyces sp.]